MRVILASKSPRRRELLGELYSDFEIICADADEDCEGLPPREAVVEIAERKGEAVLNMLRKSEGERAEHAVIISSDTLVALDDVAYGKPADEADALRMLTELSGRTHYVHTGVCVHYMGRVVSGVDSTAVVFRTLSAGEIREYISTGEPSDKAGAYAIQGIGGKFVERIDGRYDTVVGLSLSLTSELIERVQND